MKYSLAGSILTLATVALQAAAVAVGGKPYSSSSYYADHTYTKWVTTTCWHTTTKTAECSYGGDYATGYPQNYDTVDPQVYKGYDTIYETVYESGYPYPHDYPYEKETVYVSVPGEGVYHTASVPGEGVYHTVTGNGIYHTVTGDGIYHTVTGNGIYHTVTGPISTVTVESSFYDTLTSTVTVESSFYETSTVTVESSFFEISTVTVESSFYETSTVTVESSFYETSTVTVESSFYSTISSTITVSSNIPCQCTDGPWIRDPGFDGTFPGVWFPYQIHSGKVTKVSAGGAHGDVVELNVGRSGGQSTGNGNEPQLLEQAVVVPAGRSFAVQFDARRTIETTKSILYLTFWLGPNMVGKQEFDAPSDTWPLLPYTVPLTGVVPGASGDCVPLILRIEVSVDPDNQPNPGQEKAIQIDNIVLI